MSAGGRRAVPRPCGIQAGEHPNPGEAHPFLKAFNSMQSVMYYLSLGTMYAVVAVLLAGLWVMTRGRSPNLSQKLMRWRVGLQFVAIVLLVVYAYVQHH